MEEKKKTNKRRREKIKKDRKRGLCKLFSNAVGGLSQGKREKKRQSLYLLLLLLTGENNEKFVL